MKSAETTTRRRLIPATLTLLGCVALATSAAAGPRESPVQLQPKVVLSGPVQWSAVSGHTGFHSVVLGPKNKHRAAYAFNWWEHSDEPCKWQVWSKKLDGSGDAKGFIDERCRGNPGDMKAVYRPDPSEFITGARVCLTDKKDTRKDKLKGVRLFGRMIDPATGELGPEHGPEQSAHKHCRDWSQKVTCPAGQVAAKIRVHYSYKPGTGSHAYARGLSLGCRAVGLAEPPSL